MKLSLTQIAAPDKAQPYVASIEIADHLALISGGYERAWVSITSDGKTLHKRPSPVNGGLRGAKWLGDELWMVGEYGLIAVSEDLGVRWTRIPVKTRECIWDIARDAKGGYWCGCSGGVILRGTAKRSFKAFKHVLVPRDDRADPHVETVPAGVLFPLFNALWNGRELVKVKGLKGPNCAVAVGATGTVIVVGDGGAAFRSTDGGASFKAVSTGVKFNFNDVAYVADGFIAVGEKGAIRRSEDDGLTWKPIASPTKTELWSIGSWGTGAFIGGTEGLVLRIEVPNDTYWRDATDRFAPLPIGERLPPTAYEAAVIDAIDDPEVYRIYGDYLQTLGDPRGELIALTVAGHKSAKAFAQAHPELLSSLEDPIYFLGLRWGVIESARLSNPILANEVASEEADIVGKLARLLGHPAARFLKRLRIGVVVAQNEYSGVLRILAAHPIPSLRELFLGDTANEELDVSETDVGDVSNVYAALPNLEILRLRGGKMTLGAIALPKLRELEITTGGLTKESFASIASATMPLLETAIIYFGAKNYGATCTPLDVDALLRSDRFPKLRHLGLVNAEFSDDLCANLVRPLIAQLTRLDLGLGWLGDAGVDQLVANAAALVHLEVLDISKGYVTPAAVQRLIEALPSTKIVATRQRKGRGSRPRFTSIAE